MQVKYSKIPQLQKTNKLFFFFLTNKLQVESGGRFNDLQYYKDTIG